MDADLSFAPPLALKVQALHRAKAAGLCCDDLRGMDQQFEVPGRPDKKMHVESC